VTTGSASVAAFDSTPTGHVLRPATPDDLATCAAIWRDSLNDYLARLAQPDIPDDLGPILRLYAHLQATDPATFLVAERGRAAGGSGGTSIDAFVVATALEFDAAVIASGDTADLARLAAPYRQISLFVQTLAPGPFGVTRSLAPGYLGPDYDTTKSFTLPDGRTVDRDHIVPEDMLTATANRESWSTASWFLGTISQDSV